MPLARIDLRSGTTPEFRATIGEVVYAAMLSALGVPADDRFQVITEHGPDGLIYDPHYLDIERTDAVILIQVTLNAGRSLDQKKAFYRAIADGLHERLDVRREDVFVNLVEVAKENWSFGNGEAQYA